MRWGFATELLENWLAFDGRPGASLAVARGVGIGDSPQQQERDPTFNGRLRTILVRDPFEVSMASPIVKHVENAVQKVTGKEPVHSGQSPWMDSALLVAAGVETVVIGPAGEGAHAAQEWVDLRSVETLAGILAETAVGYCG